MKTLPTKFPALVQAIVIAMTASFAISARAADSTSPPATETLEAAVSAVLARLSPSQKSIVKGTAKDSLFLLLGEWGDDIEERLQLKNKSSKLATTVCKKTCSAEEATLVIMKAAWDELQK
jgi:hypothetical protein